jgi:hypothetical protein
MSPERVEGGPAEAKRRRVVQGTTPVKAWGLHIALDLNHINNETFERIYKQADKVSQINSGLIRYLYSQRK